ncbi:MAG: trk system potassium uptake protein TrkH [Saprospiraceae bacterium]|jgi:trk system potassium uptake protein TrkH
MINSRIVINVIGFITIIVGLFMLLPALVSYLSEGDDAGCFFISSLIIVGIGGAFALVRPKDKSIKKREGYLIVGLGWLAMCIAGSLPYLIHHDISISDALFESTSGFTTTGATIFIDIESLSFGTLFWRSLTQWIGGMGIIVFTIAIFPLLGIGGVELFVAESPGPQSDKIHPRIKEVAKRLWFIYVGLTAFLCTILYIFGEMNFFDSINHAMTTMSTGGFSTKNASIAHFSSLWVQYPILIFMFVGGMNYTIIYLLFKRRFTKAWKSDEFRFYITMVIMLIVFVSGVRSLISELPVEQLIRESAFQLVSVITTTGYVTADYTSWHHGLTMLFFILLFVGACSGSTSGGIKMIRHLVFLKNSILEFKRILHPAAFVRLKVDGATIQGRVITHILVFLLFYLILFVFGSLIMTVIMAHDPTPFMTGIGSTITCISNVGPAIGSVGPVDNFAHIPAVGKIFLSFLMIVGRLEVFTVLIILTPYFWKSN